MKRRAVSTGFVLLLAGGFYLVLIDTVSSPELYAMAGVLMLSVIAFELSRRQGLTGASFTVRCFRHVWRPFVYLPAQLVIVSIEAVAQLIVPKSARGGFRAVPFAGGAEGEDIARFALTESLGSFTPNTIVIGIDDERGVLLVHQLRCQGSVDELDVLRLGSQPEPRP